MKILWLSRFMPLSRSAEAGNKTFYYYFNEFRNDARFQIHLISSGHFRDLAVFEEEVREIEHESIAWGDPRQSMINKLANIESKYNPFNRYAGIISNSDILGFKKTLKKIKKNGCLPDIVILEWTQAVILAPFIRSLYPKAKIVASEHDVMYVGYERRCDYFRGLKKRIWSIKARIEKAAELDSLKHCDLILPHNPDNINLLAEEGIEREKMQWLVPYFNNMSNCTRKPTTKDILFFGAMSRPENYLSAVWFIDHVMPLLTDLDIRFVVLGSNPPKQLLEKENNHIHITGFVDSITPYFESSICMVAPLVLGAGIKVKVLEGLSSGIPVITNDIGIEGIPAKPDVEYIHASEAEEYASAIRKAVNRELEAVGANGRDFINRNYDLDRSARSYKSRLLSMI